MKKYLKDNWISIVVKVAIIACVLVADLLLKAHFMHTSGEITGIKGVITFEFVRNTGAAFGIFSDGTIALSIFTILFVLAFTVWDVMNKEKSMWLSVGYAFVVAGAIGNLVDRLALGYVRDFIKLDFWQWIGVFNIADVAITVGCICYFVYIVIYLVKHSRKG